MSAIFVMDNNDLGLTGSKWAHGNSRHAMGTGLLSRVEARQPIFEQRLQGAHQTGRFVVAGFSESREIHKQ